ncbi:MAG: hypothetical protein R3D68_20275 [Hyphomicrobiaceae bacterium]
MVRNPDASTTLSSLAVLVDHDTTPLSALGPVRAIEPMARIAASAHLQSLALVARRTHAWLDIPGAIAKCQTPQDLITAQAAFWQTAQRDYAMAGTQFMCACMNALSNAERVDLEQLEQTFQGAAARPAAAPPAQAKDAA